MIRFNRRERHWENLGESSMCPVMRCRGLRAVAIWPTRRRALGEENADNAAHEEPEQPTDTNP